MRWPKNTRLEHSVYADTNVAFHLTAHVHRVQENWSAIVADRIWQCVTEQRDRDDVELFAACLMRDHLHLLVRPTGRDVLLFMNAWKSYSTRATWTVGLRGQLWQAGYWDRAISTQSEFDAAVEYIIANPVKAGLAEKVRDWPHSWAWYWDE